MKMHDNRDPSAFSVLKPLCINFLQSCSIENVDKLERAVKQLDAESVQSLQEYIVLPVRAHLRSELQEKVAIRCINFLTSVFKTSNIKVWEFFADIFLLMISKITDPKEIINVLSVSEELKLSVCENILSLVQNSSEEVLNEMYSLTFRPNLAHAFYLFNIMVCHEKSKSLQKATLSVIGVLTYSEMFLNKKFKMTEEIASEALASCLPGLSIALQKVACGDFKQGHNIVVMALRVLGDLLILVVGDDSFKRGIANNNNSEVFCFAYKGGKKSDTLEIAQKESIPLVLKSDSWFQSVSEKLKLLIEKLTVLSGHDHWKVRLAFLKFSKSVLLKCTSTLESCISVLLPAVFGLSVDDNEVISSQCGDVLISFAEQFQNMNSTSLSSVLEDNIEKLTSQLMKCKISANNNAKLTALKNLQGYISILGSSLDKFLFSMIQIERIILTIISLLEFDLSILSFVEEVPNTEHFDLSNSQWPKKRFKYFDNDEILNTVCNICTCLGRIENSRLLIDYLLDKLSSNDSYVLQCIFLIGSIIKGLSSASNATEKYSSLVSDVLELFLSNAMFDQPIQNEEDSDLKTQIVEASNTFIVPNNVLNKNVLQICLILEAIAKCSECLKSEFKSHLMQVLCPVMEKAGSSNYIISQCGRLCLYFISRSCKYNSVNILIQDNADYITNILMINFHQYFHKPEMAVVLRVAMEQSDSESLILFRDLIFQILNVLDYNQDKAYFLMAVLFPVIASINKWFPSQRAIIINSAVKDSSHHNLRVAVSNYMALKKTVNDISAQITEDSKSAENIDENSRTDEDKPDVPLHVNITCEIFMRCIHLQSSENAFLRMLILETVELCIIVLRDYEKQLLPLIHEFWSPFLKRFSENTLISKAFNVLLTIANECGDFVHHRTFKDVMPKLVLFLKRESFKSRLKCNFRHYQWTQDHSLQVLVLSEIGYLCTKLDVDEKDINSVASVCIPYLEKEQPKVLQDSAIKSIKALAIIDPDAIWFYWNVLYSKEKVIVSPHNHLLEISFPFSDNSSTSVQF